MPAFAACLALSAALFHRGHAVDFAATRRNGLTSQAVAIFSDGSTEDLGSYIEPVLGVKHVSKTGGTFLINLLNEMSMDYPKTGVRKYFPRYFQEYPYPRDHYFELKPKLFIVSSVRNPCSWYVSQWSFAAQFDKETLKQKYGVDFFGDSHNQTTFATWIQWAMGVGGAESADTWLRKTSAPHFGVLSLRFWESFVKARSEFPETPGIEGYDTTRLREYTEKYDSRQSIETDLSAFDPSVVADCWVHDETYMEDLRYCLREYEARSRTSLNWEPFEREIKASKEKATFRNKSEHDKCKAYYTPELEADVQRLDRHLFRAFGYSTCCGNPDLTTPQMTSRHKK